MANSTSRMCSFFLTHIQPHKLFLQSGVAKIDLYSTRPSPSYFRKRTFRQYSSYFGGKEWSTDCYLMGKTNRPMKMEVLSNGVFAGRYDKCSHPERRLQASFGRRLYFTSSSDTPPSIPIASQSYGTWALSSFSHSNSARIQPYLEIEKVLANLSSHEDVIKKRDLAQKPDLSKLAGLFEEVKRLKEAKEAAEKAKDENADKVQELLKTVKDKKTATAEVKELREKGKSLREDLRKGTNKYNEANDNLISLVLSIPNKLDSTTPLKQHKVIRDVTVKEGAEFRLPEDIQWNILHGVGPSAEYSVGPIAMLELDIAAKCQKFLLSEGFSETGNVDFVKRVLLDGSGLDPNQFLKIREQTVKSGKSHATYLVGGATFPAFLALFAQSVIQDMSVLPIKFFVIGRCYSKVRPTQNTAVQVFIACKDEAQEKEEFMKLAEVMEKFYSEEIGVAVQSRLLPAPQLRSYEQKKIIFVRNDMNDKMIGDLTTVGDYVSKRLLCCYNEKRSPKFLHLITGQFFNITDFLRPLLPIPEKASSLTEAESLKTENISSVSQLLPPPPPSRPIIETATSSDTTNTSTSTSNQTSTKSE